MPKLNQIIAIEGGTRKIVEDTVTKTYQVAKKPELFQGRVRTYTPTEDGGETMPPESQLPQTTARYLIDGFGKVQHQLLDMTATKVEANTKARADVKVDGQVVLPAVPVETLLFLERRLEYTMQFLDKLPTLDPTYKWELDADAGFYRTDAVVTNRNKKVLRNHVKAEATDKHPAQVETFTEDQKVGEWNTVLLSGALPATDLEELKARTVKLQAAVKMAREEANNIDAPEVNIGERFFNYLFEG